jgi:hypothetical protein
MNNLTKPIIIGSVIIALSFIGSQLMKQNSIEKQQQKEIEAQENQRLAEELNEIDRQSKIDYCLSNTYVSYSKNWDIACKGINRPNDCQLPAYRAEKLEEERIRNEELCYKRYK